MADPRAAIRQVVKLVRSGHVLQAVDLTRTVYRSPVWRQGWDELPEALRHALDLGTLDWDDIGLAESTSDSLFNLGASLWRLDGSEDLAIEVLAAAVTAGSSEARLALVDALHWRKRFREAEEEMSFYSVEEIQSSPRLSGVAAALDFEYRNATDDETVRRLVNSLAQGDDFKLTLAKVYIRRGEWSHARRILTELVAEGNVDAPIMLGNLLRDHFADISSAEAAYRHGIELGDAFSAYNLGMMLTKVVGRHDDGISWIRYAAERGDSVALRRLKKLAR